MFGLILLLLVVVPIVELYVLMQVADGLGWLTSLSLLVAISLIGGALMKWQAAGAVTRVFSRMRGGELPSKELIDGALMIFGGSLLLTPGFFTDAVGIAMFIPPLRAVARAGVLKRVTQRVDVIRTTAGQQASAHFGGGFSASGFGGSGFGGGDNQRSPFGFATWTNQTTSSNNQWIDVDEVDIERIDDPSLPLPPANPSRSDDQ